MSKQVIYSKQVPEPIGPYSQAIKKGNTLYCSGQVAINPKNNELVLDSIENETKQVMENIHNLLKAAEMDFVDVVKTTILLSDMSLFVKVNEIYAKYFLNNYPARETYAVKGLPKGVNLEISVIAVKEK